MIAILCAAKRSVYKTMESVEVYDIDRDVRTFCGGMPVVAHPPCRSWSAYCAHQAKPLPGEKELGPLCVDWLMQCGGVLEHPANSRLWDYCNLPKPGEAARDGMWSMWVQQSWWGDTRTKNTWLLFSEINLDQIQLPFVLHNPSGDRRRWQLMSKRQRAETSTEFAKWLIDLARTVTILEHCE